jgi:hypothetical protein
VSKGAAKSFDFVLMRVVAAGFLNGERGVICLSIHSLAFVSLVGIYCSHPKSIAIDDVCVYEYDRGYQSGSG